MRFMTVVVVVVMVMIVVMISDRAQGAPVDGRVGGCVSVDRRLGQLIQVCLVLLTQRVVLALQSTPIGSLAELHLLRGILFTLSLFVGLLLGLCLHLVLIGGKALLIKPLQMMRIRIALGDSVLAQVEILIENFAVAGLVDQFATGTGAIGVLELCALGALIDVLRTGNLSCRQQQRGNTQMMRSCEPGLHLDDYFAPMPSR